MEGGPDALPPSEDGGDRESDTPSRLRGRESRSASVWNIS